MNIEQMQAAIESLQNRTPADDSRAATYLRTYPALLAAAQREVFDDATRFLQLSTMVYGWMPRVLRLDANYIAGAVSALQRARIASEEACDDEIIRDLADCLSSTVGASKLLHFVNPEVFPIWDSKVERVHLGYSPSQHHMQQPRNYLVWLRQVHAIRRIPSFRSLFKEFGRVYQERMVRVGIVPYDVTEVRAIEAAAFELSGSDEEDG